MGETASGDRVTGTAEVRDAELRRFLDECLEGIRAGLQPEELWLFGSRVTGHPDRWSDIDVLVVSQHFEGVRLLDRMELFDQHAQPHRHVDALCFTPEEFQLKANQPTLVAEIVKHGLGVRVI